MINGQIRKLCPFSSALKIKMHSFFFLKDTMIDKNEMETELSHLLIHSPNACNNQGWARLKSEAKSIKGFQVSSRDHSHYRCFPVILAGRWIGS